MPVQCNLKSVRNGLEFTHLATVLANFNYLTDFPGCSLNVHFVRNPLEPTLAQYLSCGSNYLSQPVVTCITKSS